MHSVDEHSELTSGGGLGSTSRQIGMHLEDSNSKRKHLKAFLQGGRRPGYVGKVKFEPKIQINFIEDTRSRKQKTIMSSLAK